MKNFSDLLATELSLSVVMTVTPKHKTSDCVIRIAHRTISPQDLNQSSRIRFQVPLLELIDLELSGDVELESLKIEGHEMWPQYCWRDQSSVRCRLDRPFYQWLHEITGQGWLLVPTVPSGSASAKLTVAN